jgi:glycosyl transferase family 25
MRIRYINLDARADRRATMESQFEALGLAADRFCAVDMSAPRALSRSGKAPYTYLTKGEIGCWESHLALWREFVAGSDPFACIMEDDAIIASDFPRVLDGIGALPPFDLLKLDQGRPSVDLAGPPIQIAPGRHARRLLSFDAGTCAYVISRAGAGKLLRAARRYYMPIDVLMYDPDSKAFHDLEIFHLSPTCVTQQELWYQGEGVGLSDIARGQFSEMGRVAQFRLRLRRVLDNDTKGVRQRRKRAMLDRFPDRETFENAFHSPTEAHLPRVPEPQ